MAELYYKAEELVTDYEVLAMQDQRTFHMLNPEKYPDWKDLSREDKEERYEAMKFLLRMIGLKVTGGNP